MNMANKSSLALLQLSRRTYFVDLVGYHHVLSTSSCYEEKTSRRMPPLDQVFLKQQYSTWPKEQNKPQFEDLILQSKFWLFNSWSRNPPVEKHCFRNRREKIECTCIFKFSQILMFFSFCKYVCQSTN
jgi:hypothetical protein